MEKQIKTLKEIGYITRQELAEMIGMKDSPQVTQWARDNGVGVISIIVGNTGRLMYMFLREDVNRILLKAGVRPCVEKIRDIEEIEKDVDEKKWKARLEAKIDMILAMTNRMAAILEEADAMDEQ